MKKYLIPLTITATILALVLVACGKKAAAAASTNSSSNPAPNGTPGAANFNSPLPLSEQLVIGTFKLEGTTNAVTKAQAANLIPLWQAYAQLTSSNTAAQAEIDAVVSQIQQTLTPQQVQAITALKLSRQDLSKTMSDLGLSNSFGASGTPRARTSGGGGGFFPGGGDAGGPPGGDAGGPPGGDRGGGGGFGGGPAGTGGTQPTPNATQQALRTQFANRIPTPLMDALISLLQKKG
jgi:hypothetical protein